MKYRAWDRFHHEETDAPLLDFATFDGIPVEHQMRMIAEKYAKDHWGDQEGVMTLYVRIRVLEPKLVPDLYDVIVLVELEPAFSTRPPTVAS